MTARNQDLVNAFEARSLDPATFHHDDHIYVGYELLLKYAFMKATLLYAGAISEMATKAGAPKKFNLTITIAFMSLIAERMAACDHEGYEDFMSLNLDLMAKDLLEKQYTPTRLYSDLARSVFLMPDIIPA